MDKPKTDVSTVVVIGDLVASKRQPDRTDTQRRLVAALQEIERTVPAIQPMDVTIGDEFQGAYPGLFEASLASLLVRLTLLPEVDTRFGLGRGGFTVFDEQRHPLSQDGPAWWAARDAVEMASQLGKQARTRHVRTWFGAADDGAAGVVNAFFVCRDDIVGRMTDRARRLLRSSLLGLQQADIAAAEGVTQSAVSQSLNRSGAYAVMRSAESLRDVR